RDALKHADLLGIETKQSNIEALIVERLHRARLAGDVTKVKEMLGRHGLQYPERFMQHRGKSGCLAQEADGRFQQFPFHRFNGLAYREIYRLETQLVFGNRP